MIIGVDAGCLGITDKRLQVGVYQVAVNLFKQLKNIDTRNIYYLYSFVKIDKKLLRGFGPNVKNIVVKPARGWTKVWLPLQLLKDKPDIFLGLNQALPLKLPLQTYKSVVLIHDLIFEKYPTLYSGSYRKLHRETKLATETADSIITVSEAVRGDILDIYKVPAEKITVAYEGVRQFPQPKKLTLKNPYFLYVGALKPQKNIPFLLEGFTKFIKSTNQDIDLLLVGGDKWMDKKIGKVLRKSPKKTLSHITFLGTMTDAELAYLYDNAEAFVSPSISEGFGLPFVEALSFGLPVIGPKTGSIPEVIGEAGVLIDPKEKKQLVKAMSHVLDPEISADFRKNAVTQSEKFSWEQFAHIVFQTLESQGKPRYNVTR